MGNDWPGKITYEGMEDIFGEDDKFVDLPSTIAIDIMSSLKWAHGPDVEEHCNRYGDLQEVIEKTLINLKVDTKVERV